MSDLLKRLEIIQNAVALGDEDIIALQAKRLPTDAAVLANLLASKEYVEATAWITNFRQNNLMPTEYIDKELAALRLELESLEHTEILLITEKAEYDRQINEFIATYMQEVGPILEQILRVQMQQQKARAESENTNTEEDEDLEQARQKYEEFRRQKQEQPPPVDLTDEEETELKQLFKRAATKCHPDKLPDAQKESGKKLFQELEEAHRKKDLAGVRRVWQKLQDGDWTAGSAVIIDKEVLRRRIGELRQATDTLQTGIAAVREDETWQLIQSLAADNKSWDSYFADIKKELEKKLAELENKLENSTD